MAAQRTWNDQSHKEVLETDDPRVAGLIKIALGGTCPSRMSFNVIMETTFSQAEPGVLAHKHVLHVEQNGRFCYNSFTTDGTGWHTRSFTDLEKATRFFLKEVAADRKTWVGSKHLKVILPKAPAFEWERLSQARQVNIEKMSTSEQALLTLMCAGGSWADRVYQAIPDVIDRLVKRAARGNDKELA